MDKCINPRSAMDAPLGQKQQTPTTVILDRFKTLMKERDEVLTGIDGEDPPAATLEEVVGMYEEVLAELMFNSKPVITELTIIAGEQRAYAEGIADAICNRILEVPVEQKLPSLYLLDSIVKNIGREYVRYFAARLPEVFCETYNQVDTSLYPSMRHLFRTWSQVFPSSVLRKIENVLQFSSQGSQQSSNAGDTRESETPSPRPGHGIHINPKYLEARQQLEESTLARERDPRTRGCTTEFRGATLGQNAAGNTKGWSGASSKFHKTSAKYGEYDLDHPETAPSLTGTSRIGPLQVAAGHESAEIGKEKPPSLSKSDVLRMNDKNGWRASNMAPGDDGFQQSETRSAYNLADELSKHRPRQLIYAYGSNSEKSVLPEKPLKLQRLNSNGIATDETTRKWQSTEEEEFIWEEMSPTSINRNTSNKMMPYATNIGTRISISKPNASILDSDLRNNWSVRAQLPPGDEVAPMIDDRIPISSSRFVRPQIGTEREHTSRYQKSQYTREPWNSPYVPSQSFQHGLSTVSRERIPFPENGLATSSQRTHRYRKISDAESLSERLPGIFPDSVNVGPVLPSTIPLDKHVQQKPNLPHGVSVVWPPVYKSQSMPPFPTPPHSKEYRSHSDFVDFSRSQKSLWQSMDAAERKASTSSIPFQIPGPTSTSNPLHLQGLEQTSLLQYQPRDPLGNINPPASAQISSHLVAQSNQIQPQGQQSIESSISLTSGLSSSPLIVSRVPDTSIHPSLGALPPLPPGPPPGPTYVGSHNSASLISGSSGSGFSGLISSLMSQGLISLEPSTLSKDSIGVEFDPDLLKVRHQLAIDDLYINLPRQCTTCGLRFKCQEEHSSHMDWHVTKNRNSRNRKQKPSRKWFVSVKEWLSGAETLGTDVVPGFMPAESVVETNEEKQLAVPADEDQNLCALCGEPFEDFYSDEADEWMYKGAVYLNAPEGSIEGLDRSELGPIVHAKCRSESTTV